MRRYYSFRVVKVRGPPSRYYKDHFLFPQITGVVAAVLRSAQPPASLDDFQLSLSTSRRQRRRRRSEAAADLRASFAPPRHAVVHWDGKMIKVGNIF